MAPDEGTSRWKQRYGTIRKISSGDGAFELYAARDRERDEHRVVVVSPSSHADHEAAAHALTRLAEAHSAISHPAVAPIYLQDHDGRPPGYVVFDFPAVADGITVLRAVSNQGRLVPYGAADSFISSLRAGVVAAHSINNPESGQPLCLGRIAYGNLLFSSDGAHAFFGFGHNVATNNEFGVFGGASGCFQAPEVALDAAAASPRGDYLAVLHLMRSFLPLVALPTAMRDVALGQAPAAQDAIILNSLEWFNDNVYNCAPEKRASIEEAVAVSRAIREHFNIEMAPDEFRHVIADVLMKANFGQLSIALGPDARWIAVGGGETQPVSGRGPMRGILLALYERQQSVGAQQRGALSRDELFAAGWPGQRADERSRANRVYVALSKLRGLGLRDALEHVEDGYRIKAKWRLQLQADAS